MNWGTEYLLHHLGKATATLRDVPRGTPRHRKSMFLQAMVSHSMWLQESTGSGNRAKRRLQHDRWLMMNRELYG